MPMMTSPRVFIVWAEHGDTDDSYGTIRAAARDAVTNGWEWSGAAIFDGRMFHDRRAEMARQCGRIRDEIAEAEEQARIDAEHLRMESAAVNFLPGRAA